MPVPPAATLLLPLQGEAPIAEFSTAELVLLVAEFVTIALGLAIAYIAYRGYRRNASRPMLFIAVGFVLVTGLPALVGVAFLTGVGLDQLPTAAVTQLFEIAGMACILYALVTDG